MTAKVTPKDAANKVQRTAHLAWVPIALMRVSPLAQREKNAARVDKIAANFDPEQIGAPTVSNRGGHFYIIDGQHRIEAMKEIGWEDQKIQCWVYEGLDDAEEAEMFLLLNDTLTVDAYAKFRVGVHAGRPVECDIDRIVRAAGLVVSREKVPGAIGAVGTLRRIYSRAGAAVLGRTLRIIRDAYGDAGFDAAVVDGIGYLCARYNGELEDAVAVVKLQKERGGYHGLLQRAETIRRSVGGVKGHAVAAAAVDIINAGRGGKKLPNWFRDAA